MEDRSGVARVVKSRVTVCGPDEGEGLAMQTGKRVWRIQALPLLAACVATPVLAEVMFIDGGYAQLCAEAAHDAERASGVQITGSRLTVAPIDLCTQAISNAASTPHELAGSYNNRGVLWFSAGSLDAALADFDAAIARQGDLAVAYVNKGYTLGAQQRWQESLEALDRGIELGSADSARAHFNRGIAHEELGHVREAYADYRKAAELAPEWPDPQRELQRFQVRRVPAPG
jgi:tetratricopeptide (TPR) repeat protein